jgi:integrase
MTISELAAGFLDHAKATLAVPNYTHHRIVILDFLTKFYGDVSVDSFNPVCLKTVRSELIRAVGKNGKPRFCRGTVNDYVCRIVRVFEWGVEEGLVKSDTWAVLKAVKPLPEGYAGTFAHEGREDVPDDVIRRTLPFMTPTIQAIVKLQRLTGCRPSEIFNMRVGHIDQTTSPDLWLYRLPSHKTEKKTKRKKIIPLGKPEQELLVPYLEGKSPESAVFSPRTSMEERRAENRANRKSKLTPSQREREAQSAAKPSKYREFYDKDSYRQAVEYAIKKANKTLPPDQQIPHWTPYQLRHTAATAMELEQGLDEAQALLDHSSADTTRRYAHARLQKLKELALHRIDPFAEANEGTDPKSSDAA